MQRLGDGGGDGREWLVGQRQQPADLARILGASDGAQRIPAHVGVPLPFTRPFAIRAGGVAVEQHPVHVAAGPGALGVEHDQRLVDA